MFADKGHAYAARVLEKDGVELLLGSGVTTIGPGHVTLSDGRTIKTRCVIWGGGLMAAPVAGGQRAAAGPGRPDRRQPGLHGRRASRACSSSATSPTSRPRTARRIRSSGRWRCRAAVRPPRRSSPTSRARQPKPFSYLDKGTMAMIGRGAAVAQVKGVELHGKLAFTAWLGVHAALMTGGSNRVERVQELGDRLLRQGAGAGGARPERDAADGLGRATMPVGDGATTQRGGDGRDQRATADYDVIIIGSGAGGGTLAAAPRAVRQADPDPRARRLAAARGRELGLQGGLRRQPLRAQGDLVRRQGQAVPAGHPLLGRRRDEAVRRGALPAAARGLRRAAPPRRHLAGLADLVRRDGAVLHQGRAAVRGPRQPRRGLDRGPTRARQYPFPALDPRAAHPAAVRRPRAGRLPPVPCAVRRPAAGGRPAQQPLHPLPDVRRLPVPRAGQVRRRDASASGRPSSTRTSRC